MILIDSSVWIDYFNGIDARHTEKLESIIGIEQIAVGDLVLTEVLQGYRDQNEFFKALKFLSRFDLVALAGPTVAIESAQNFVKLQTLGFTVRKTIDTIIATRCIMSGFELLHNDRDFLPFEKHLGLKCLN